jgi:hypothetical protein
MGYLPCKKNTLLIPSGDKNHLFVILTDKCQEGSHLLVNFSTIRPESFHDSTCVVLPGEHPFIKQPSYIEYRRAEIVNARHIIKCTDSSYFVPNTTTEEALFNRICDGVSASEHTPKRIKTYFLSSKGL